MHCIASPVRLRLDQTDEHARLFFRAGKSRGFSHMTILPPNAVSSCGPPPSLAPPRVTEAKSNQADFLSILNSQWLRWQTLAQLNRRPDMWSTVEVSTL